MKTKIRRTNLNDAEKLLNLINSSQQLTGDDEIQYTKEMIIEYITNPINLFYVYEIDNKIAGIVLAEFWKKAKFVYLTIIIVDEEHQGKGIGKKLMNYIEELAKKHNMGALYGYTEINNEKMKNLFSKLNYKKGKKYFFYSKVLK